MIEIQILDDHKMVVESLSKMIDEPKQSGCLLFSNCCYYPAKKYQYPVESGGCFAKQIHLQKLLQVFHGICETLNVMQL